MIFTAVDKPYFWTEGRYLLSSAAKHLPHVPFSIVLVNADSDTTSVAKSLHPKLEIVERLLTCPTDQYRGRMCCMRSDYFSLFLRKKDVAWLLYLDSDTLIRNDLSDLMILSKDCELSVRQRPHISQLGILGTNDAGKFNSGVIWTKNNATMLDFFDRYKKIIELRIKNQQPLDLLHNHVYTAADQELLYLLYKEKEESIRFVPLPEAFNDSTLQMKSGIWHGKGVMKHDPRWQLEQMRYSDDLQIIKSFGLRSKALLQKLKEGLSRLGVPKSG